MADFWSYRRLPAGASVYVLVREVVDLQRQEGATFYRVTLVNDAHARAAEGEVPAGLWVEGWLEVPDDQGPFEPPLIVARSPSDVGGCDVR